MSQLSGKVALVTGASSGLGAAVAPLFADRGATVFGIARDADRMATVFDDGAGGKYRRWTSPAAGVPGCRRAVRRGVRATRRAGQRRGLSPMRHTESMTDEDWADDLAVNLNGPFYLCHAALPHLL